MADHTLRRCSKHIIASMSCHEGGMVVNHFHATSAINETTTAISSDRASNTLFIFRQTMSTQDFFGGGGARGGICPPP